MSAGAHLQPIPLSRRFLFKINETFAAKIAACAQELGISHHKLNVREALQASCW
ncbi:hypothetical protein OZL92_19810 [Bacillus sonorensis]|uniref:Uncharacterized protein n=1 Tax=Bacillus sonorensis L12 TaxID=1274524 RepID=M5PH57_9BACI|nr:MULTISPECIES: hypothetical protein [Bacillus]TWK72736.1 hypothetical protein CHCC20335_1401 [Bacillus paralicheniformis]EME76002.1 hypothetical protein BSONL12_03469 [Bacillus sonorensis L12]MCF7619465.1 hypothetical protein [Bacillus sonorensis]MCY7855828.1 hypothetical protein [Bacillus sonorensis]MCY8025465.1 hypothetical protein [Bacillus sonorensis]